jgi:hypothetical protein
VEVVLKTDLDCLTIKQMEREKGPVMMFHRVMGHESQSRSGTRGGGNFLS